LIPRIWSYTVVVVSTSPEVTPDQLRQWYEVELLSEEAIAEKLGTYQVWVSRKRKKYGIPTITQAERSQRRLPSLSDYQVQVLTGSLLGDGWMDATSKASARFQEGHCVEQAAYTEWKAEVFQPFVSGLMDRKKNDLKAGKTFYSKVLVTTSCPQLRFFYDLFYPAPDRVRVFPSDLAARMTPLVLAVWYMDDGSLTTRGEPRIAFGLDDESRSRALKSLRGLGLSPVTYGEGGNQSIQFPKQAMKFRALIEPHIIPCMAYKLPTETAGQVHHREARELTPEKAASLYQGGLAVEQIAKTFNVGASTVGRRLLAAGTKRNQRPGPKGKTASLTLDAAQKYLARYNSSQWAGLSSDDQERWVADVFRVLRSLPLPVFPAAGPEEAKDLLGQVQQAEMSLIGNVIQPIRRVGISLCNGFFPNRYEAVSLGEKSAFEAWHTDKLLERAIRFQFKVGDPVLPHRVLRAVTMNCRTPTIFRPTVARFVYQRYCSAGGTVWDPCSGFGGRLLGALAAGVEYVGTDVDSATVEGNLALAKTLGREVRVEKTPAEKFVPPPVDLVFTSPPYFNRELYSQEEGQSWKQYSEFDGWVEGFLRPVVQKARKALRPTGRLVLNVANVRSHREAIPLVDVTMQVAQEEGFRLVETLRMPLPKLNRDNPSEPVLVFE
jgi:hypothetical protein